MRNQFAVTVTALLATQLLLASAGSAPIPVEIIGKLPAFEEPMISPNGKYVASRMMAQGRQIVVVQRLKEAGVPEEKPGFINVGDKYFNWFEWADNERLLIGIRGTAGIGGRLINLERMASISRDGSNPVIFDMKANDYGFLSSSHLSFELAEG